MPQTVHQEKIRRRIIRIIKASKRVSKEWRLWHKNRDGFPSDGLIDACNKLDKLFPGKKASEIEIKE